MTTLLIVAPSGLAFGCVKAHDLCGNHASIVLYENLTTRYVDAAPRAGDMLLCRHHHSSVYVPLLRILQTALCLRSLPIPNDVLSAYFPLTERLRCI